MRVQTTRARPSRLDMRELHILSRRERRALMSHAKPAIAHIHQLPLDIPRPRRLRPHQHVPAARMPRLPPFFRDRNRDSCRHPRAYRFRTIHFQLPVQRPPRNSQLRRRPLLMAAARRQRLQNRALLQRFQIVGFAATAESCAATVNARSPAEISSLRRQNRRLRDHVAQLPDIARPRLRFEHRNRGRCKAQLRILLRQEIARQRSNIRHPLAAAAGPAK